VDAENEPPQHRRDGQDVGDSTGGIRLAQPRPTGDLPLPQ
jgi:hypothetical protein